ncbi:hypothetical protein ABZ897_41835 [Nonomuraea sp. NPDC046802]|uniref:hypothetical protein n=1 Tax=Nonomuraea sp. NPDC046802 TaxID=3154919 RepID=UPI00340B798B
MASPKDVHQAHALRAEHAAAAKALKAERRAENERNRQAKLAAQAEQERRAALPIHERLAATAAKIDAKWVMPAPPLPAGSYTECGVCVGRGMCDRYGQVPAAAEQLRLVDGAGREMTVIDTCPTHVPYVQATARRRGFRALPAGRDDDAANGLGPAVIEVAAGHREPLLSGRVSAAATMASVCRARRAGR